MARDEDHLMAAVRYVALSPVRAHLLGEDDGLVCVRPVLERIDAVQALIDGDADDPKFGAFRAAETTGRPLGDADFVAGLERILGRPIARRAPGRKPVAPPNGQLELL